jgi:hypothetical protein
MSSLTKQPRGRQEAEERLLSTVEVGKLLHLHQNDVRLLIADRKLAAKKQVVRGECKRPRMFVLLSEVRRYINDLPDARTSRALRAVRRRSSRSDVSGVIQFV